MSYFRKRRSMSGLGDVAGPCQVGPSVQAGFVQVKQAAGNLTSMPSADAAQYPSCTGTTPGASSGGGFFTDFFKALVAPVPVATPTVVYQPAPSSGISTTTLAVAGGAALLLVAVLASRK